MERPMRLKQKRTMSSGGVMNRYYAPPEILLEENHYNETCDMWSLGCLLAEMLKCTQNESEALDSYIFMKGTISEPSSPLFETE